ncbi:glycosyltransferase [Hydrogenophaga sp.]|uniref:glycosyltransferase n=1 Tax=Hydrogenophaga sp. TaxID=1904254 RepID=UPI003AF934A7
MKILIITYSYTPDLTPRAFRWSALAQQFLLLGHEVHILCAARLSQEASASDDGVKVHRVQDWLLNASRRVTPASTGADAGITNFPQSKPWHKFTATLRKFARAVWRATYWPDFACGWIIPATAAARQLCTHHDFDWMISVSHPFTGHVVGHRARTHAGQAKWLVDIGDPFHLMSEPAPNNQRLYSRLSRLVENRILTNADAVCVTTESTRQMYRTHFAVPAEKIRLAPPLLSLPALPQGAPPSTRPVLRLVFVGTLYRKLRSPGYLLACFEALLSAIPDRKLELHLYGAVNDCAEELAACPVQVRKLLFVHGMVSRTQVHGAMLDADILVNIGNDSASQLASKVIEYMAMGRPILNLVSIEQDTSVQALSDYPATLTLKRNSKGLSSNELDKLRAFVIAPPNVSSCAVERVRERFSASHVANLYIAQMSGQPEP